MSRIPPTPPPSGPRSSSSEESNRDKALEIIKKMHEVVSQMTDAIHQNASRDTLNNLFGQLNDLKSKLLGLPVFNGFILQMDANFLTADFSLMGMNLAVNNRGTVVDVCNSMHNQLNRIANEL